jgi:hypothetical protein
MRLGDLRQAHTGAAVSNHLLPIHIETRTPDLPTFKPRPFHACLDTFDEQASFQLAHRANDDEQCPTKCPLCINTLALTNKLNAHAVQFVDGLEQVLRRTRQPVARPDQQNIEPVSPCVVYHPIEFRASRPRAGKSVVGVLTDNFEAPMRGELAKFAKFGLRVLIHSRNTAIKCGSFHRPESPWSKVLCSMSRMDCPV